MRNNSGNTKKQTTRVKSTKPKANKSKQTSSQKHPLADAGQEIGGFFGMPKIGKALGGIIGQITGTGDYETNFDGVKSNQLLSSGPVPSFGDTESTILTHREYIQDVISSPNAGTFQISNFPINPGQNATFPWLSDIASNFEEYEIMGMVFEYKAMSGASVASTNTALGSVILATEYDPTKPAFTTKQQMENYFFAQSVRPSECVLHAVECKNDQTPVKRLYIRTGATVVNTDLRWSDYANFSLATTGLPGASVVCGELWVTYKVKLHKPRLPITVGDGGQIASAHVQRNTATSAAPLGATTTFALGPLALTITGTSISFIANPQSYYLIGVSISPGTSSTQLAVASSVGLTAVLTFNLNTSSTSSSGSTGGSGTFVGTYQCSGTNSPTLVTLTFSANTIVGNTSTDIFVMQYDNTITK